MKKGSIKKILVPLDGSKNSFRGLDKAISFARAFHATITGVFVIPIYHTALDAETWPIEKELLKHGAKIMNKAKTTAAQNGIIFYDKILYGDEGVQIVKFAQSNDYGLIVIGSRGMGSVKEIFFGSTSHYVLHKSKMPVLVVK